jgi:hypothetical protein
MPMTTDDISNLLRNEKGEIEAVDEYTDADGDGIQIRFESGNKLIIVSGLNTEGIIVKINKVVKQSGKF